MYTELLGKMFLHNLLPLSERNHVPQILLCIFSILPPTVCLILYIHLKVTIDLFFGLSITSQPSFFMIEPKVTSEAYFCNDVWMHFLMFIKFPLYQFKTLQNFINLFWNNDFLTSLKFLPNNYKMLKWWNMFLLQILLRLGYRCFCNWQEISPIKLIVIESIFPILINTKGLKKSLLDNSAITLGRLGWNCQESV